jgi:hypothetical protein
MDCPWETVKSSGIVSLQRYWCLHCWNHPLPWSLLGLLDTPLTTSTRRIPTTCSVLDPSLDAPVLGHLRRIRLLTPMDTVRRHLRCSRRSPRTSGFTAEPLIASRRFHNEGVNALSGTQNRRSRHMVPRAAPKDYRTHGYRSKRVFESNH